MVLTKDPEVSNHELALTKVAAWAWYKHGSGFEQTTPSESSHNVTGISRHIWEAMETTQEYIRASTHYLPRSMSCTTQVGSSLLDAYEIERISKDLDLYIQSSCDQYYHRKFIDVVHDPSGPRIVSSPSLFRDSSRTKEDKTIKEKKWFGFRKVYNLCRLIEGGVVENVQFPTLKGERR